MEILTEDYELLREDYEILKESVPGSYEAFCDTSALVLPPEDINYLMNFILNNPNCSTADVIVEELQLEEVFFWKNKESLELSLRILDEVENHNNENRYIDYDVFESKEYSYIEDYVMRLCEILFNYGIIDSKIGREKASHMNYVEYEVFFEWMDLMHLTEKGYEYLEELKQKFYE